MKKLAFLLVGAATSLGFLYTNCGRPLDVNHDLSSMGGSPSEEASTASEQEQLGSRESTEILKVVADGAAHDALRDRSLRIAGSSFAHGLPVTTRSTIRIDVPEGCSSFVAQIGVDDSSKLSASAHFEVIADSASLFKSEMKHGEAAELVNVDLSGARTLMLQVDSSSEPALANWAEARLQCKDHELIPVAQLVPADDETLQGAVEPVADEQKAQVAYWSTCSTPTVSAIYVAPNGKSTNSGSISSPFQTLQQAVDSSRKNGKNVILLRAGTYVMSSPVTLDSRDNDLKIGSYPCETAILDGGRRLSSGWRSEGNGVYSLAVSNPATFQELMIDWKRAHPGTAARFVASQPLTSDWKFAENGPAKTASDLSWFNFYSGDLAQSDFPNNNVEGMHIQYMTWERLEDFVFPLKSIDWSKRRINMSGTVKYTNAEGTYRILNNPKYVRDNYDFSWSWKSAEKRLYVKVPGSSSLSTVMLPSLESLININGASNISVMRLKFQGVVTDGYAIDINGGGRHKIGANRFEWVGSAIKLKASSENLIGGNQMISLGGNGILMEQGSNKNKIYGNNMDTLGTVKKHIAGVFAYGVSDNMIAYNNIANSSRYAVAIKNWDDSTKNYRNIIERNWIYNNCTESADCGAVEMLGRSKTITENVIRHNIIDKYNGLTGMRKTWTYGFKGFGVYMDDSTSGVHITQNLIRGYGYGLANIYLHGGDKNVVDHNVGIMDDAANDFIRMEKVYVGGDVNYDNKIERNVIYATKVFNSTDSHVFYTTDTGIALTSARNTINYNLLWNTKKYKNGVGFDQNSVIANPLFINYSKGDFRFQSTSPALKAPLSIKQPEFNKVGNSNYSHSSTYPAFWTAGL